MTWFSSAAITMEDRFSELTPDVWASWPHASRLGTSVAGSWFWNSERTTSADESERPPLPLEREGVRLSAPREILQRMAEAARSLGRSESDIWVEAACEWLLRHEQGGSMGRRSNDDRRETSAGIFRTRRKRTWSEIDGVLDTLRDESRSVGRDRIPA